MINSIRELVEEESEFIDEITKLSDFPPEYASMLALWLAIQKNQGWSEIKEVKDALESN